MRRLFLLPFLLGACDDGAADVSPDTAVTAPDAAADARPDAALPPPPDAAAPIPDVAVPMPDGAPPMPDAAPASIEAVVPLGETLFFAGDDYLVGWGGEGDVEIVEAPDGSTRAIVDGARFTPGQGGVWVFRRGGHEARVEVRSDTLTPDTFLNFNYSPVEPLAEAGGTIWVACPTSNGVQETSPGNLLVPTGSWPTSLATWRHYLLVSQTGRDTLGFLDTRALTLEDAIHVGNEPAGILVDEPRNLAYVALSGADEVARVDLETRTVVDRVKVGRDPRAMVRIGGRLFVASTISDNGHPRGLSDPGGIPVEEQRDVAVIDLETFEVTGHVLAVGTILRGLYYDEAAARLLVAHSESDNLQTEVGANSRPHIPRIAVVDPETLQVERQLVLDGEGPAPSPFTIGSPDGTDLRVVTLSAGRSLRVSNSQGELQRVETGHDPRGLLFRDGRVYTYAWLDNALQSWTYGPEGLDPESFATVEVGRDPTPVDVKEGQRIFSDASFSRHGDFACNSCHIDGLTDGLVWNLLLDGDVNTLAFRNVGGTDPFLWNGALPTLFDFSREVLRLVGARPAGEHLRLLTTYMQSVTAPPNPYAGPGGRHTELGLHGRDVFNAPVEAGGAGCVDCHYGPAYTGQFTVEGKTPGIETDVPSLIGVYDTGPWGRIGQWRTLEAMVDFGVEFTGAELSGGDRQALIQFVRELPGDLLYLNSVRPLKGTSHAHFQTPVELSFSGVLKAGQEASFEFVALDADDVATPVEGAWVVSGRYARFEVADIGLPLSTRFRITVAEGLSSTLGQRMRETVVVEFGTGELPDYDLSGLWEICLNNPALGEGCGRAQFVQTAGGRVSGNLVQRHPLFDIDHMGGHVSGDTFFMEPFIVKTDDFGDIQVDSGEMRVVEGEAGGFAERAVGELRTGFANADATMRRLAYPQER